MNTEAIVASAGWGRRLDAPSGTRKPYLKINNIPILALTLRALAGSKKINSIIVVVNSLDMDKCRRLIAKYGIKKVKALIRGGRERSLSVRNGLAALDADTKVVLIHDGVRPFINSGIIDSSIEAARKFGACVVGVPVKATIKAVVSSQLLVARTINRKNLWEIQTPQVFRKDLIMKAYEKYGNMNATDDAMLVEKMGKKVKVIMGSYKNIKITTPEDLVTAEAIAKCA